MGETPQRKRRWLQFSLRSLLIFTVLCAVGAALFGRKVQRKRQEQAIVGAICRQGGSVYYDSGTEPGGPVWLRSLLGDGFFSEVRRVCLPNNDCLQSLQQLPHLQELDLRDQYLGEPALGELQELAQLRRLAVYGTIRPEGMRNLNKLTSLEYLTISHVDNNVRINLDRLKQLKSLNLHGSPVSDRDLANISHLTQLESVNLSDTSITDDALKLLSELPQLKSLFLDRGWVHDDGLTHLKALTGLEILSLGGTPVTDAGLANLKEMKQLRSLDLTSTKITEAGVWELKQALPNCQIDR